MALSSKALRAIGSSTTMKSRMDYVFRQSPRFSSVAIAEDLVDVTLKKVLQSEIKSAKSKLKISQLESSSNSFPCEFKRDYYWQTEPAYRDVFEDDTLPFNSEEDYSWRTLRLEKEFPDGERVTIRVDMEAFNVYNKKNELSNKNIEAKFVPMDVKVFKPSRNSFVDFRILVTKEGEIDILSYEVYQTLENRKHNFQEGPEIENLSYEVQQSISEYLEIRGIKCLASFLLVTNHISEEEKGVDYLSLKFLKNHIVKSLRLAS